MPTDATITEKEITFAMPTWLLPEGATYEQYKELANNWITLIETTFNNERTTGRLKGLVGENHRRSYEKSRFHSADSTEGNERTYSNYRKNHLSEGRKGKTSEGIFSETDGQHLRQTVEQILEESSGPQKIPLPV